MPGWATRRCEKNHTRADFRALSRRVRRRGSAVVAAPWAAHIRAVQTRDPAPTPEAEPAILARLNPEQRAAALELAAQTPGVTKVEDHLTLAR